MRNIVILSSSVRNGRNSHRIALFFKNYLAENGIANGEILDLAEANFPIFDERLRFMENPSTDILAFADTINKADGIIIVTPEYNGGYPASLKNVIDLLYAEWKRKPVAIATVSAGSFGGTQVITSLQFSLWKIGALTVPATFPVPTVEKAFTEDGVPTDVESSNKRAKVFVDELMYWVEAKSLAVKS